MNNDILNVYLISFLTFVGVIVLVEGFYLILRGLREEGSVKINRRLKALSAGGAHGKEVLDLLRRKSLSSIPILDRFFSRIPRIKTLDRTLEQAGLELSVSRYILLQLILAVLLSGLLIATAKLHFLLCIIVAVPVGFAIPSFYVAARRKERLALFASQLPDALDFIARNLRAGNPFSAALKSVASEMPDPIGTEFGITFDEMNYGLELDDALKNLGVRSGSEDMNFFITAVLIQKKTGGNLANVLNKIATVMRARAAMHREIGVLSAEMRLSANVLIALPFIVAGMISLFNPGYLTVLFDTLLGQIIIVGQIVLMMIGYMVMKKMINFHV